MSDIRKWIKLMESVPAVFSDQPTNNVSFKKDATVMVNPRVGGGTGRFMQYTNEGSALIDIKGIARELSADDFSAPERDYEDPYQKGNDWFSASVEQDTPGTQRDKPEHRAGDMVQIADVYGSVIGPGIGIFIAYSTSGKECIINFDDNEIVVPTENVASVLEQDAKDNFNQMDNDGSLSPMSFGSDNVRTEVPAQQEPAMDHRDEFSKWIGAVEEALSTENKEIAEDKHGSECDCGSWDCPVCFPNQNKTNEEVVVTAEEDSEFTTTPRSGNGVKLGDIVTKTEFRKVGQDSPLTYGEDNLDEEEFDDQPDMETEPDAGSEEAYRSLMAEPDMNGDDAAGIAGQISYMQDMGLSKSDKHYDEETLMQMMPSQLQKVHTEVMGTVTETSPKPTQTKSASNPWAHLDDLDNQDGALSAQSDDGHFDDTMDSPATPSMPRASAASTRDKTRNMNPSELMRDFMGRIDPQAGAGEAELPDATSTEIVAKSASDVPAVISSAMQAAGMQTPEWHTIDNLPGYSARNTRGMGRQVFSMFTSTPLEQIQTIANVDGQGPNTNEEIRAVASWLMNNAEDLGDVKLDHGRAVPGYKPDVKEYSANGIRFHCVRDPMGQYIYAYPDADAKSNTGQGRVGDDSKQAPQGNMPQLREGSNKSHEQNLDAAQREIDSREADGEDMSDYSVNQKTYAIEKNKKDVSESFKFSLFEQMQIDDIIKESFSEMEQDELNEEDLEESTLSRKIGKQKGGQKLVQWLHRKHKLDNEADLTPAPFSERLLWKEYKRNPDNFIIVSAANGVAGIKPYEKQIKDNQAAALKKGKSYDPGGDSTLKYQIIAFTDDGQQVDPSLLQPAPAAGDEREVDPTVMKARMGKISGKDTQNTDNVFNLLADQIGAIRTVYVTGAGGDVDGKPFQAGAVPRDKMNKRADMKKSAAAPAEEVSIQAVFKKVQPVLKKLADKAYSQLSNRMQRYATGGNDDGVEQMARARKKLKDFLATIDTSSDVNLTPGNTIYNQVRSALVTASGARSGTPEYTEFLQSAANGNVQALRPVLDALREKLVGL